MTIKNSAGSTYRLSGPNTLMRSQGDIWDSEQVKYINWDQYAQSQTLNHNLKLNIDKIKTQPINREEQTVVDEEPVVEYREQNSQIEDDLQKRLRSISNAKILEDFTEETKQEAEDDMPVYKSDGTQYELGGKESLKSYRPGAQDQTLFDSWDKEQIELGGSPVVYHPVKVDTDYDDVYMESRDQTIVQEGYKIYASFEPIRPIQEMSAFGIDSPDEMLFNFNLTEWRDVIGSMPALKSLFFCEWDNTWWEVIQNNQGEIYKLWTKFRLQVVARKYQRSRADQHPTFRDGDNSGINIY